MPSPNKRLKKGPQAKMFTPYIAFATECRKSIIDNNPGKGFGEISRLVGEKWRQLPESLKQIYSEKAKRLNEETAVKLEEKYATAAKEDTTTKKARLKTSKQQRQKIAAAEAGILRNKEVSLLGKNNQAPKTGKPLNTQNLLGSEAYVKYMARLSEGNKDSVDALMTQTTTTAPKLPVSDDLRGVRQFLMADALNIRKIFK